MENKCELPECNDRQYTEPIVVPDLPVDGGGTGGGGGEGNGYRYTFSNTGTGWSVREDGRLIFNYSDKNDNTTYTWEATNEGWLVKDNLGNVVFTYKDKVGDNTTYTFEQTDDCGFKVTDNAGKVVFEYDNSCSGTTYTFEQKGVDFTVTNDKTGQVVFTYKGTEDTNTTYTWEKYKDGFKVVDNEGTVAYIYDPDLGQHSDGSYSIDTLLTTVFKGHTNISTGQIIGFTPTDLVVGETLVYDGVGTVGVITADNGDGTYQVTTMTTSPGSRQGVRLGSVEEESALPATCAEAEALGWQTPQLGDFAYVTKGGQGDEISEYVVTKDDDCNLTWTFSHSFNAGDYQAQSTASMSGMILTGGAVQGTFGKPIDPSTLIRGVMRNGILLTPDAQGKVNVVVDPSHVIVNALPTTGIVDNAEYIVIDNNLKVTGTWVHDNTGWYQTYEPPVTTLSHQIVTTLPTTNIEQNVEYVVVDGTTVKGTYVYDPTKGWLQTEKQEVPDHQVVTTLPTTGINDNVEYVVVGNITDPVKTYQATYVHTDNGWIKTSEATGISHLIVTALPTTGINENVEYIVMTDPNDPTTFQGTWVRINGNWVQTEKLDTGLHIVTALPTTNIDTEHTYILVEDLDIPDSTFIGQYAYSDGAKKWIDISPKKIVEATYNVSKGSEALKWGWYSVGTNTDIPVVNTIVPWKFQRGNWVELNNNGTNGVITIPANTTVEIETYIPLRNSQPGGTAAPQSTTAPDMRFNWFFASNNAAVGIGNYNPYVTGNTPATAASNRYTYSTIRSFIYENKSAEPVQIYMKVDILTAAGQIQGGYSYCLVKEIGRAVDPVAYLTDMGGGEDTPVGSIISYMGNNAPNHYLTCDGKTYNVGTYPTLEAHFIEEFGKINQFGGDGITTWAVPDLRGEFLRGSGDSGRTYSPVALNGASMSVGSGADVGTHQDPTYFAHTYYYSTGATTATHVGSWNAKTNENEFYDTRFSMANTSYHDQGYARTGTRSNPIGGSSRPTNTSVKYCIKYESVPKVVINNNTTNYRFTSPVNWLIDLDDAKTVFTFNTASAQDDVSMITGNDSITVPMDGYYALSFSLPVTQVYKTGNLPADAMYNFKIKKNGTEFVSDRGAVVPQNRGNYWSKEITALMKLKAGDNLKINLNLPGIVVANATSTTLNGTVTMSLVNVDTNNTAEVMMKPNTWAAGVEQNFGDGVYGMRIKGTLNVSANVRAQVSVTNGAANLLNCGGQWIRGNKTKIALNSLPLQNAGTPVAPWSAIQLNVDSRVILNINSDISENGAEYDVWVLYTK